MPDQIARDYKAVAKKKKKNNPTEEFKKYCELEPWMPECKKYEI
tara:strand:+ start:72 stop:203 length:132 start_codon:yes stop_codon:yes gene_type:complete